MQIHMLHQISSNGGGTGEGKGGEGRGEEVVGMMGGQRGCM